MQFCGYMYIGWGQQNQTTPDVKKFSLSLIISALSATNDNCYIHRKSHWPKSPLPPPSPPPKSVVSSSFGDKSCRMEWIVIYQLLTEPHLLSE